MGNCVVRRTPSPSAEDVSVGSLVTLHFFTGKLLLYMTYFYFFFLSRLCPLSPLASCSWSGPRCSARKSTTSTKRWVASAQWISAKFVNTFFVATFLTRISDFQARKLLEPYNVNVFFYTSACNFYLFYLLWSSAALLFTSSVLLGRQMSTWHARGIFISLGEKTYTYYPLGSNMLGAFMIVLKR